VARSTSDGGATVTPGFGRAIPAALPSYYCDACDEDSDSLVGRAQEYVDVVTGGLSEFRRPYVPDPGVAPLADGPWLEEGYRRGHGASAGASADIRGELFEAGWAPWTARS
jgi:hypothetical protein